MKKIILMMLCVFFSHAYAGIDDSNYDWNKHVQTGNWKHNKVTPYNTAGSTQPDYFNSSKYNVSSSRDVTSNGSKYKQTVNVAVEASKAQKAATIANRAKNMAEYAKKLGKASLPVFLGSAALTGLLNGIGWVMDEGGKVTKKNEEQNPVLYKYYSVISSKNYKYYHSTSLSATQFCKIAMPAIGETSEGVQESTRTCYGSTTGKYIYEINKVNPLYQAPVEFPDRVEVTPDQIADAVKKALEENNAAQAAAIAEAIKDAFSESDLDTNPNTGKKENPIADRTKKALDEKGTAELKEKDDPTVCVPRQGDLNGQCHSMPKSEADSQPTLKCEKQGWQIDTDDSCVYVVDPNAPTKPGTVDKPKVDPESGELPDACVWFDVHCKWLEWTKEDNLDDDTELDIKVPEKDNSNTEIRFSGMCPADKSISLGSPFNFEYKITYEPYCMVAEKIKAVVIAAGLWISVLIIAGIKGAD